MAQLNFTLDDGILKDLMLGDGEKGYSNALATLSSRRKKHTFITTKDQSGGCQ